jgi:hypothetical protein
VRLQVTDDSGFLALVDPDAYSGFVCADWDVKQLLGRFEREMAERRLLIWGTEGEGCWTVEVSFDPRQDAGVREVRGSIVSTRGRLCLTNYESLAMAAQFPDVTLPEPHQADLALAVAPGAYRCRIVQRSLVGGAWDAVKPPEFLVELLPDPVLEDVWRKIPWRP